MSNKEERNKSQRKKKQGEKVRKRRGRDNEAMRPQASLEGSGVLGTAWEKMNMRFRVQPWTRLDEAGPALDLQKPFPVSG